MLKIVVVNNRPFELYSVNGNGWTSGPRTLLDVRRRLETKFQLNKLSPAQIAAIDIIPDGPDEYCFAGR